MPNYFEIHAYMWKLWPKQAQFMTILSFDHRDPDLPGRMFQMSFLPRGGRVMQRCWVNFQCRGVLLIWIIVGQGPIVLAICADGDCLDIFSLNCHFSFYSPSLWETARYRLKYCLKGPLNPEQPTNQIISSKRQLCQIILNSMHSCRNYADGRKHIDST